VLRCKSLNEGIRDPREQELYLQIRAPAPTPRKTKSHWGYVAGKQGSPRGFGVDVAGLWEHKWLPVNILVT